MGLKAVRGSSASPGSQQGEQELRLAGKRATGSLALSLVGPGPGRAPASWSRAGQNSAWGPRCPACPLVSWLVCRAPALKELASQGERQRGKQAHTEQGNFGGRECGVQGRRSRGEEGVGGGVGEGERC